MVIRQNADFPEGYTAVTELDGKFSEMKLDFGILKIRKGKSETFKEKKERAYLLMTGKIVFEWEGKKQEASRKDFFSESPYVLHVPEGVEVKISALEDSEIAIQKVKNTNIFESRLYTPEDCTSAEFGKGTLGETSTRIVRTVFDASTSPKSGMVMGEVINFPGKWSSYPPHAHAQPEIYHYRFYPKQGFGFSMLDDDAYVVKNGYTCTLDPDKVHSQASGPGYAMYYIWMIPHIPEQKWSRETTYFHKDHKWLLDSGARIWPEV